MSESYDKWIHYRDALLRVADLASGPDGDGRPDIIAVIDAALGSTFPPPAPVTVSELSDMAQAQWEKACPNDDEQQQFASGYHQAIDDVIAALTTNKKG